MEPPPETILNRTTAPALGAPDSVITTDGTQKVRNVERDGRATVAQVEGPRWLSIAGSAHIERDAEAGR